MKTSVRVWQGQKIYVQALCMLFAVLFLFVLAAPQVRAASITQSQIEAVTVLLRAFDVDSATVSNVQAVLNGKAIVSETDSVDGAENESDSSDSSSASEGHPGASMCGLLERTLKRGDSGKDVSYLQEFLKENGDLTASTTGYFGEATEHALQLWQTQAGIVTSGDADSTGFGVLGPKTRQQLMESCKAAVVGQVTDTTTSSDRAPTCTLEANDNHLALGESVTLKWESKNATWASSESGKKGPTSGSITLMPQETTTYVKRVYNQGGEGACTTTVTVGDDSTAAPDAHVVAAPSVNMASAIMTVGLGLDVLWQQYRTLLGF